MNGHGVRQPSKFMYAIEYGESLDNALNNCARVDSVLLLCSFQ